MPGLNLKTANIISLTKLELAVRREYACRFNLADDASLFTLLKLASESSNSKIKMAYFQFFEGLPKEEKNKLLIHHGSESKAHQAHNQTTHTYRGVTSQKPAQNLESKYNGSDSTSPLPQSEPPLKIINENTALPDGVTKIVYRGSVIYKKDGKIIENPFDQLLETSSDNSGRMAKRSKPPDNRNKKTQNN